MSAQRFSTSKQFIWQSVMYQVKRLLPGHLISVENMRTGDSRVVSFADLAQALFAGELRFVEQARSASQLVTGQQANLSDYPSHLRAVAEYRLQVIRPLLSLAPPQRSREAVAARVAEIKQAQQAGTVQPQTAISVASVYRWIKEYEQSGQDIRVLVGNSHKQGGKHSRLTDEVESIVCAVIQDLYYVPERVTSDDIHLEVVLRIEEENKFRHAGEKLSAPSKTTIWRRIDALDEMDKLVAKQGKRIAKRRSTQYGKTDYPSTPLERAEIDHTPMDIIVVDGKDNLPLGRPTLTYCLDTTTRYPLGFHFGFDPPSYLSVMECLHHAILTKGKVREKYGTQHDWIACGIPGVLAVDNAKEFIGVDLLDACNSLGIELIQMPLRTPHFKAGVERMFGTLNTGLLHKLPGTTFSNPQQRGDYNSEQAACIDLETLDKVFHIFLLDDYAEDLHKGLGDIPARRWESITQDGFFPRLPASAEELKILLGRVAQRVIQPYGIEFMGLRYNSQDLAPLRTHLEGAQSRIKYDPTDLGCIHVYDPNQHVYIQVECLDKEYAGGLSLWKHRVILNLARKEQDKVDILSLARARRQIQEIVEKSKSDKKIKSRSRIARWETGGKPVGCGEENTSLPEMAPPPPLPSPSAQSSLPSQQESLPVALDDSEDKDWSAGYDLPNTN